MLKIIAQCWQDGGLMHDVIERLAQMISDVEYVYTHAWEVCKGQAVIDATKGPIKEHDRAVNRQEREIRRLLLQHLTINPGEDASGCLAVMSMAKDIERIGDLAEDIFRLGVRVDGQATELKYFERLDALQQQIAPNLPLLERAVRESSDELANEILDAYKAAKPECRQLREDLFGDSLPTRETAATVLMIHTFARINAHIGNTATGIIFPLENIDFVSRGLRQQEKEGG